MFLSAGVLSSVYRLSAGKPPVSNLLRSVMGKEARIALLLAGTACLLAVMVDWAVEELNEQPGNPDDAGVNRRSRRRGSRR
jgi:hypothetical protein